MIDGEHSLQILIDVAEKKIHIQRRFDIAGGVLSKIAVSFRKFLSFDRGECWETPLASFRDGAYFNDIIAGLPPTISLWTGSLFGKRGSPFPQTESPFTGYPNIGYCPQPMVQITLKTRAKTSLPAYSLLFAISPPTSCRDQDTKASVP